ncbi:MAG: S8 family serine peptidase, partial [Myxococcota bacterium]
LVERVYLDIPLQLFLAQGVPLTGADQAAVLGVTGTGINVAVVDTGVMVGHSDLTDDVVSEACFCVDTLGVNCCPDGNASMIGAGAATDTEGHGTMVSGIITSAGGVTSPGVAPDSGIVAVKVDDAGSAGMTVSSVDSALDWLLTNHASLGVRVVNLSLGTEDVYTDESTFPCTGTSTEILVSDLAAAGVATFIASGNSAEDSGISFPACIPDAISVGGVYDGSVGSVGWSSCSDSTTAADQFVCHTNSGPMLDLLAPDWRTWTTALGGGAVNFGGTSAAAPYAAGLAALLFEQDPSRTPAQVEALLVSGAPMVTNPDNGLSFPRADVSDQFPVCGDGEISGSEECDDGDTEAGDCCSPTCSFELAASVCDDEDACTSGETCDGAGVCGSGSAVVCDDALYCNGSESCDTGLGCQAGTPPVVDDGVGCTLDSCDEVSETVLHAVDDGSCDNEIFCDGAETCDVALDCQAGTPPVVDDGVGCTLDSCDEVSDTVLHVADDGSCDNATFCDGAETCDVALDCQAGTPPVVDDGVACTIDSCDEGIGGPIHVADDMLCDDSDQCTVDTCDVALGCQSEAIPGCGVVVVPMGRSWTGFVLAALLLGSGFALRRARHGLVLGRGGEQGLTLHG